MSTFLEAINKTITNKCLFEKKDHLLVACSGGVDSMVLIDTLRRLMFNVSVAHVNYRLRGQESDADQRVVESYCDEYQIRCHTYIISDRELELMRTSNLQSVARDIRYLWMRSLCSEYDYSKICVAHHADDQIETLWLNALRGSGVTGLRAMREIHGDIIRPLLTLSRQEIIQYADRRRVPYRQDASNDDTRYMRNYLRREILPHLYDRDQRARAGLLRTIQTIGDEADFIKTMVDRLSEQFIIQDSGQVTIGPMSEIRSMPGAMTYLYHVLGVYDYSRDQVEHILYQEGTGSKSHDSTAYRGVWHRDHLNIRSRGQIKPNEIIIDKEGEYDLGSAVLLVKKTTEVGEETSNCIFIDEDKVDWPLVIRTMRPGDRFYPAGMGMRSKKLSDYCSDLKLNTFEKEDVRLLCCGGEIAWVIGSRADERFLPSPDAALFIKIKLQEK